MTNEELASLADEIALTKSSCEYTTKFCREVADRLRDLQAERDKLEAFRAKIASLDPRKISELCEHQGDFHEEIERIRDEARKAREARK